MTGLDVSQDSGVGHGRRRKESSTADGFAKCGHTQKSFRNSVTVKKPYRIISHSLDMDNNQVRGEVPPFHDA